MNRGTYKKILTSLFGIILLFASVFYILKPNQNETAFAQTAGKCRADIQNTSFELSNASKTEATIKVSTIDCSGQSIYITIFERDSVDDDREDFKISPGATVYGTADEWRDKTLVPVTSNSQIINYVFDVGDAYCSSESECEHYFEAGIRGGAMIVSDTIPDIKPTKNTVKTTPNKTNGDTPWNLKALSREDVTAGSSQNCSIIRAKIVPANYDPNSNKEYVDLFLNDTKNRPVEIQVQTSGCSGKKLYVEINHRGGQNIDKTFKDNGLVLNSNSSLTKFNLKAGGDTCDPFKVGSNCKVSFRAIVEIDPLNKSKDVVYDSIGDKINGVLHYETNSDWKNIVWSFVKAEEIAGGVVEVFWYWENADGVWFNSQKSTKEDCEKQRDNATNSKKPPSECRQDPPADKIADGSQAGEPVITDTCDMLGGFTGVGWCFANLVEMLVNVVMGTLVGISGSFFDLAFDYSISSESYGGRGNELSFLKDSWTLIRDLANLGFIFVLLYMSIQQIISSGKSSVKKDLPKLVIVAIFINFSFFIGSFIVDLSNVLARAFFTNDTICVTTSSDKPCEGTLSEGLSYALRPQEIIKQSGASLSSAGYEKISPGLSILISLISGFMLWKIFKAFFSAGFLFLGRIVQIWIVLIVSPLAFLNEALSGKKIPNGGMAQNVKSWAMGLLENAMVAPLFIMMLYLVFISLQKINLAFAFTETQGMFASLIGLFIPVYAITLVIEKIVSQSKSMAGTFANSVSGIVQKIGGAVIGGGLALTGLGFGAAMTKGGGKLLGNLGQKMINREGKGNNFASRWTNSKLANLGGKINQYSKDLPNKKFDPRNSAWGKAVAGATGVNIGSYSKETNQTLGYLGLKPGTSFKERDEARNKKKEDDIKRRKVIETTDKMDYELAAEYAKRNNDLESNTLSEFIKKQGNVAEFERYQQTMRRAGKTDKEIRDGWINSLQNKDAFAEFKAGFEDEYKKMVSGSVELFEASSREAFTKAAKKRNEEIEKAFVDKEMRKVYGGKDSKETTENMKADNKRGIGAGDIVGVGGKTGAAAFATAAAGAVATAGVAGAAAGLATSMAYEDRQSSLSFIRARENKKDAATEKKRKKFDDDISRQQLKNNSLSAELERLENTIKILSQDIQNNTIEIKDSKNNTVKFKELFDRKLTEQNEKLEKSIVGKSEIEKEKERADKKTQNEHNALTEALKEMDKTITESIMEYSAKLKTATASEVDELNSKIQDLKNKRSDFLNNLREYDQQNDRLGKIQDAKEKGENRIKKLEEDRKKLGESEPKKDEKKEEKK